MALLASGTTIEKARRALQEIDPPFLLRKYEATVEDYELLADEDLRCEFLDGVLLVHSPATIDHEDRLSFLHGLLRIFVDDRQLGRVLGANAVMQLGDRRFCPDISFLRKAHAPRIQQGQVVGPMDLAVEFLSKSTRDYDLGEKRAAYREGRVPEIWIFDPQRREFHADVLTGGSNGSPSSYRTETLREGRWASKVLEGFWFDVTWLWKDPLPNVLECYRAVAGEPATGSA